MGRRLNQKRYRKTSKGREADKRYRQSVLGIESRIRNEENRLVRAKIIKALKSGSYDVQDMYSAIREEFPDHTEKMILDVMKLYPPRRRGAEVSVQEYEDSRGIVIPVTGTFPEYYEEGNES